MKIAILGARGIPSTYSGFETFIGELAPRLVARGHQVTVYCREPLFPSQPSEFRGVGLVYLPSIEHKAFSTLSHSAMAILHASVGDADVILAVNAANGMFGWIPRLLGKPCVINVDGMEWLRPKWSPPAQLVFKVSAKLGCLFFNAVVTDADAMQRTYAKEFGINTHYIAYGANVETSENPEVLADYGLEPGQYYLAAGRLVPDNNADLIIQGFLASGSNRVLAVAGGADYHGNRREEFYHARLRSLSNDRVRLLGHIDRPGHFKELHCNCHAYLHGHGFGGLNPSLLQALGYGNCILALDTPFSREALADGEYGLLFRGEVSHLAEAIRSVDADPPLVGQLRQRAPSRVKDHFSWDRITEQYEQLFSSICDRNP